MEKLASLPRAADHYNVMTVIEKEKHMPTPKPKPTKADRKKIKTTTKASRKPRRKVLEAQLEEMVKLIVHWRDGSLCVLRDIDGGRCGGKVNWGHFIPRSRSKYLKYDLATFIQCDSHNLIHDSRKTGGGDPIFGLWFSETFGLPALRAMSEIQRSHTGTEGKHSIPELEAMLDHYDQLYQNRYTVNLDTDSLVEAGYYGEVVKAAYIKMTDIAPAVQVERMEG